jgi:hypothetical protein
MENIKDYYAAAGRSKIIGIFINIAKAIGIIACLYFFICSLEILSTAFKLLAGAAMGKY